MSPFLITVFRVPPNYLGLQPCPKPCNHPPLPASSFSGTLQSCPEVVEAINSPWPGNLDQPLTNPQLTLLVDRRSLIDRPGNCQAAYAAATSTKTVETIHLIMRTSSQKAKLITLTRTLHIAKGQWANIYANSKYVFLIAFFFNNTSTGHCPTIHGNNK